MMSEQSGKRVLGSALSSGVTGIGLALFAYASAVLVLTQISVEWVLLSLVTVLLASRIDIGIPRRAHSLGLADVLVFIALLLFGPAPATVLAGVDAIVYSLQHKDERRVILFNVGLKSLATAVCGFGATLVFGELRPLSGDIVSLGLAVATIAVLHLAVAAVLGGAVTGVTNGRGVGTTWGESLPWATASYVAGTLMTCLAVKLISVITFYAFLISIPIAAIIYFTYKVYLDRVETSNRHAEQLADLHLRTIEALAIAIDAKDQVTHDHVHRVQIYSTGLARVFGLSDLEIEALKAGALLHDVGKLAVPDYILNKPGALTPAEFERMKVHTIVGAEILERVGFPYPVVPVVRHHHERWDGRGYPDGLSGDEIPITARILTIADSFDSMREDRQYRKALTREEALSLLKEGSGSVFDPYIVRAFLDQLEEFESEIRERRVEPQVASFRRKPGEEMPFSPDSGPIAYEKIRSAHLEVLALYEIAQTIGTSLDLRDTFAVFSSRLLDIISYTTGILYLARQDSTEVEAAHVGGRNTERFRGKRIPSGAGITGWVVANRQPMHNCNPGLDFEAMHLDPGEAYRSATVVPLVKDGEALGALALYSVELEAYTADHARLMEEVAKLLSDAVANSMHHERTEVNALTDLLTGLPNARALRYRFEEEAHRARRHRDTFSLLLMDLDGFKAVNDRLGHQAGDQVLGQISMVLAQHVRSADFLGRYAGDEFVVVIQANAEEACDAAGRMQRAIDTHAFGFNGVRLNIGISIGRASFGVDGESLDELLLAADRAMYSDKARRKGTAAASARLALDESAQSRLM
jgi:diguanylate cyclase (GGDEF)-like protein/putative nucleotidyltransferase with HDIG domain